MRKLTSLLLLFGIAIIVIIIWFSVKSSVIFQDTHEELMPLEKISDMEIREYAQTKREAEKMRDFVIAKMYTDIFYDEIAHEGAEDEIPLTALRREPLEKLQIALLNEDIDEILMIFPTESIQNLMGDEIDLDNRIEILKAFAKRLNRNGKFESLSYQFYKDKFDNETNKGIVYLHYNDSQSAEIPFELEQIGSDNHHLYFKFITSISDFEQQIKQQL